MIFDSSQKKRGLRASSLVEVDHLGADHITRPSSIFNNFLLFRRFGKQIFKNLNGKSDLGSFLSLFQETVDIHLGVLLSAFPAFGFLLAAGWRWCRVQQQLLEKTFAGLSLLKQKMSSVSLDFTFKKSINSLNQKRIKLLISDETKLM